MKSKKYLVIGNPIEHSFSPKLQNYWLKQKNIDALYDKIKLEKKEIKNLINDLRQQKIAGCNVTVPFKKDVIPFLDELSLEANFTQSVNTIVFNNGKLIGHNTDITGFYKAFTSLNLNMEGKKIFILGAGGVVPSIIYALEKMDVSMITVSNRTRQKAEELVERFKNLEIIDWGNLVDFDVVINATSLGLKSEFLNLDFSKVGKKKLFYDLIYNPKETNFLKEGKRLGNKIENGKLMFVYQAFEAFKLWHKIEPQIDKTTFEILDND
tara:strand:- start:221 stop:1021 length:801 start_codon:yes stop_codon:yes gene_type:complete